MQVREHQHLILPANRIMCHQISPKLLGLQLTIYNCLKTQVFILTMVAVDSGDVWYASFMSLMVLQGVLGQWHKGLGSAPPCIAASWRCSKKISTHLTALTLATTGGVMLSFIKTMAECPSISEMPVYTGDIKAFTVLQQLRGGRVSQWTAAPWAVLVGFRTFHLENKILQ